MGYLQKWMYFVEYFPEVWRMFTLPQVVMKKALADLYAIRAGIRRSTNTLDKIVFVGIHVRMGDKQSSKMQHAGYRLANATYFRHAMDYFRQKYQNVHFVVCSDSIAWCHANLKDPDVHFPSGKRRVLNDLALLTLCDHLVITVGTFGWWAGFLNGGDVVYYSEPYTPGSKLYGLYHPEDLFLPHWIPMT